MAGPTRKTPRVPAEPWVLVVEWPADVPQIVGAFRTEREALEVLEAMNAQETKPLRAAVVPAGRLLDALAVLWE